MAVCGLAPTMSCAGNDARRTASHTGGSTSADDSGTRTIPSACSTTAVIDIANTLIADFECLPGPSSQMFEWFPWPNWDSWQHGAYWYYDAADDFDASSQTWNCLPTARGGVISPGHDSDAAGYVEAYLPKSSRGAGLGIWVRGSVYYSDADTAESCIDASAFTGLSFWIRGQNTGSGQNAFRVKLHTFDTDTGFPDPMRICTDDGAGNTICRPNEQIGGCTSTVCKPYIYDGTLPGDASAWAKVSLAWADFVADPDGNVTVPLNPALITSIDIALSAQDYGGTIRMAIDDIEWTGGSTEIPRDCPVASGANGVGGEPDYAAWQMAGAGGTLAGLAACDGTPSAGGARNP